MVQKHAFTLPQFLWLMLHKLHAFRVFHHDKHNAHCKRHLQPRHSQLWTGSNTLQSPLEGGWSHTTALTHKTQAPGSAAISPLPIYTHIISSVGAHVSQQY